MNAIAIYNFPEIPNEEKTLVYESLKSKIGLRSWRICTRNLVKQQASNKYNWVIIEATELYICVVGGIEPEVKRIPRDLYKDTFDNRVIDIG